MANKSYCMNCHKEVSDDTKQCECGGTSFVYGDKFHFTDKELVCDCGNNKFKMSSHMDFTDKYITNCNCTKCGNPVGVESYRNEEEMMYWE